MVNFGNVRRIPISQIHIPHLHVEASGIFSDLSRSVQMLEGEWGAESKGKLPHVFIPGKTATLVPELAVEDLPSSELQSWFCDCSERPGLGQHSDDDFNK